MYDDGGGKVEALLGVAQKGSGLHGLVRSVNVGEAFFSFFFFLIKIGPNQPKIIFELIGRFITHLFSADLNQQKHCI